jgi:hypothetical protein
MNKKKRAMRFARMCESFQNSFLAPLFCLCCCRCPSPSHTSKKKEQTAPLIQPRESKKGKQKEKAKHLDSIVAGVTSQLSNTGCIVSIQGRRMRTDESGDEKPVCQRGRAFRIGRDNREEGKGGERKVVVSGLCVYVRGRR